MTRNQRFTELYNRYVRRAEKQIAAGELTWNARQLHEICTDCAEMHMEAGPGNPEKYDDDINIEVPSIPSQSGATV